MNFIEWSTQRAKDKAEEELKTFQMQYGVNVISRDATKIALNKSKKQLYREVLAIMVMYLLLGMIVGAVLLVSWARSFAGY